MIKLQFLRISIDQLVSTQFLLRLWLNKMIKYAPQPTIVTMTIALSDMNNFLQYINHFEILNETQLTVVYSCKSFLLDMNITLLTFFMIYGSAKSFVIECQHFYHNTLTQKCIA